MITRAQSKRMKIDSSTTHPAALGAQPQPSVEGVAAVEGVKQASFATAEETDAAGYQAVVVHSGFLATRAFVAKLMKSTSVDEEQSAIFAELEQMVMQSAFMPYDPNAPLKKKISNVVDSVMLLTDKYAPDGSFIKVKARLVIKGFMDKSPNVRTDSPTGDPKS